MDAMFRKSLADLVRGLRANKKNEEQYINKCIQQIKDELKLQNKKAKMVAIQKLTYVGFFFLKSIFYLVVLMFVVQLHMLGYDISWASFNMIEVMSQPSFTAKRIGYLAASQTFTDETDVLMLATNLFKKVF